MATTITARARNSQMKLTLQRLSSKVVEAPRRRRLRRPVRLSRTMVRPTPQLRSSGGKNPVTRTPGRRRKRRRITGTLTRMVSGSRGKTLMRIPRRTPKKILKP